MVEEGSVCMVASEIAQHIDGVRAAIVFGSHARGTAVAPISDIDLLVLVKDRVAAGSARTLAAEICSTDVSVLIHDTASMLALRRSDWSFVEHLCREHIPAYGDIDRLIEQLLPAAPSAAVIREEIADHLAVTEQLADLRVLGGEHLHAYGRLFAALKSASILDGILASEICFDRHEAITATVRRRPELTAEVQLLSSLEPFWLRLRRRAPVSLPWRPRHDRPRLATHVAAARTVLDALSHPL